jgi:KDO2-lipid IV(A) lauroyltransferase
MKKFCSIFVLNPLKALPIICFYALARLLPVTISSAIFGKLARLLGPLVKANRMGEQNLELAFPTRTKGEHREILKGVWENLGRIAGEFPHVATIAKKHVIVNNKEVLESAYKSGKPILFMAGHLGNWEIPHHVVIHNHHAIALISRPPNNFLVKKLFDWVRFHPLTTIFFKGTEGSRQIMQHLKNFGALGVLFDQRLSDGEPLPFFKHPALTATGPAKLAKKYGALMIPVQVQRLGKQVKFQVTFHNPVDTTGTPQEIMTTFNKLLEGWIQEAPEQWLWLHKRWKL